MPEINIINFILIILVILSAFLHIRADYHNNYRQIYFFKPLTLIFIILLCFIKGNISPPLFKGFILAGLLLSMVGDIYLMLKKVQFTKGLIAFLAAHILYLLAILTNFGFNNNLCILFPIIAFFIFFLKLIVPNSGTKKVYVTIYAAAIMFLLWQALSRMFLNWNESAILFGLGISLFAISDIVLAYNKFVRPFKLAQILILSTYYIAQLLIALSV